MSTVAELDVFKDIISSDELDAQINVLLDTWMDTYLAEIGRQRQMSSPIPGIRSYVTLQDFRHDPENQTPAIIVVNGGTSGRPTKTGEGWYRSTFVVGISAITSTKDQASTRRVSQLYGAAVRAIMLQKKAGANMVSDVQWLGETNDTIDRDAGDQLAACTQTFELMVDGIVKERGAGPKVPSTATPAPVPVVGADSISVTVTEKEE